MTTRPFPKQHGCYNRPDTPDTVIVQDGWIHADIGDPQRDGARTLTRVARMVEIPDPMSRDCKHALLSPDDRQCAGCRWQAGA